MITKSTTVSQEAKKRQKTSHRIETTRRHVRHLNDNESVITTHTSSAETSQEISEKLRIENRQEIASTLTDVQQRTMKHSALTILSKVPILKQMLITIVKLADPTAATWDAETIKANKRNVHFHLTHCKWSELIRYTRELDTNAKTTVLSHVFMYKVILFQSRDQTTDMPLLFGDVKMKECDIFQTVCDFDVRFPFSHPSLPEVCFEVQNIPVKVIQLFDPDIFNSLLTTVKNDMLKNLPDNCTISVNS